MLRKFSLWARYTFFILLTVVIYSVFLVFCVGNIVFHLEAGGLGYKSRFSFTLGTKKVNWSEQRMQMTTYAYLSFFFLFLFSEICFNRLCLGYKCRFSFTLGTQKALYEVNWFVQRVQMMTYAYLSFLFLFLLSGRCFNWPSLKCRSLSGVLIPYESRKEGEAAMNFILKMSRDISEVPISVLHILFGEIYYYWI